MGIDFGGIGGSIQRRLRRFLDLLGRLYMPNNEQDALDKQEAQEQALRTKLFAAVGQALSNWAHAEESLVIITSMLLRTKPAKAGIILYSISNFHVWLGIIDELFSKDQNCHALKLNGIN